MPIDIAQYIFQPGGKSPIIIRLKEFLNSRTYLKSKNNRTMIFDDVFEASIAEYQKYHRLQLQGGLLNEEVYAQIGKEMSDVQIDQISLNHPNLNKLLYGVGFIKVCEDWAEVAPIIPKKDFIGWGHKGVKVNCFDYAWKQLQVAGFDLKSPGWGTSKRINPHIYQIALTQDVAGMKKGELAEQFTHGVLYLKKAIKSKIPVMVGVDDEEGSPNRDKITDHYVVIVGMGSDQTGKYFLFYDNALGAGNVEIATSLENRLYCDCSKFEIKGEGDKRNAYIQKTGYQSLTVTHIRESK